MRSVLLVLVLVFAQQSFAKRSRLSFEQIGNYVRNSEPSYEFDFRAKDKGYRITRFCNQEGQTLRTVEKPNSNYDNCLDSSQPAVSDQARSEGVMIELQ